MIEMIADSATRAPSMLAAPVADVALILEGTYPYVAGGVSSWVHQLLKAYPDRKFALLHIAPYPGAYPKRLYEVPPNVTVLAETHCRSSRPEARQWKPRLGNMLRLGKPSRVLNAIGRLHLEDRVDDELIADLASGDLTIANFLHGEESFDLLRNEIYPRLAPEAPFMEFFWHFRAVHIPLLRLLGARCPESRVYHAVSTGYAGLIGAIESWRTGRPLVITEHGLYARERELELARATWIQDVGNVASAVARPSPLRRFWAHFFRMLSKIAYHQATEVLTLSETNRRRQLADGADPAKTWVVPNGVEYERFRPAEDGGVKTGEDAARPMRVGFVGRLVPIKDVITLIRACAIALAQVDLEVWLVGPQDEDKRYARRCQALVEVLGLEEKIRFLGPQPMTEIYPQLDVVLLTSISEGQPLVILEAHAAGLPVVTTDVGACRELIEGSDDHDRRFGRSGIVTRVANPAETAAALAHLAQNPDVRKAMGQAGLRRVTARYQQRQVVDHYDSLYSRMAT